MKYFKKFKDETYIFEITKEEAAETLVGWYDEVAIENALTYDKTFRLYTAVAEVWTEDENGMTAQPGFYGVCE